MNPSAASFPAAESGVVPSRRLFASGMASFLALTLSGAAAAGQVCPEHTADPECGYHGYAGLQQAVDDAADGAIIRLAAGTYSPAAFRDVPHGELVIRGGLLIDGKRLELRGGDGVVLDGSSGPAVSAIVMRNADVRISGLIIRDFRPEQTEDDLYDGHGLFAIDTALRVERTRIERIPKMSVTLFGETGADLAGIDIVDGHVGIWVSGRSRLRLENAVVAGNDSAGIAAYEHGEAVILHSVFDGNEDDGVFADENARITVRNSLFLNNRPFAARAAGDSRIDIDHVLLTGNEADFHPETGSPALKLGDALHTTGPEMDEGYRPAGDGHLPAGDPKRPGPDGAPLPIGLFEDGVSRRGSMR